MRLRFKKPNRRDYKHFTNLPYHSSSSDCFNRGAAIRGIGERVNIETQRALCGENSTTLYKTEQPTIENRGLRLNNQVRGVFVFDARV